MNPFRTQDVHGDRPAAVRGSDQVQRGDDDVVEDHLAKLLVSGKIADGPNRDARGGEID
jgi:hypothetical protein